MTELEALREARDVVGSEVNDLTERIKRGGGMWDPRPRRDHLQDVADALDRMIRERHEAYQ